MEAESRRGHRCLLLSNMQGEVFKKLPPENSSAARRPTQAPTEDTWWRGRKGRGQELGRGPRNKCRRHSRCHFPECQSVLLPRGDLL